MPKHHDGYIGSALTIEIECLFDFVFSSCLVDADVAHMAQKREVDGVAHILLVVVHQFYQSRIVVAGDCHPSVVLLDECHGLTHDVGGKSSLDTTEIQLYNQSVCYRIAVKNRLAL